MDSARVRTSERNHLPPFERLKLGVKYAGSSGLFTPAQVEGYIKGQEFCLLLDKLLQHGVVKIEQRFPLVYRLVDSNISILELARATPKVEKKSSSIKLKPVEAKSVDLKVVKTARTVKPKRQRHTSLADANAQRKIYAQERQDRFDELVKARLDELKASSIPVIRSAFFDIPDYQHYRLAKSKYYQEYLQSAKESASSQVKPVKISKAHLENKEATEAKIRAKLDELKESGEPFSRKDFLDMGITVRGLTTSRYYQEYKELVKQFKCNHKNNVNPTILRQYWKEQHSHKEKLIRDALTYFRDRGEPFTAQEFFDKAETCVQTIRYRHPQLNEEYIELRRFLSFDANTQKLEVALNELIATGQPFTMKEWGRKVDLTADSIRVRHELYDRYKEHLKQWNTEAKNQRIADRLATKNLKEQDEEINRKRSVFLQCLEEMELGASFDSTAIAERMGLVSASSLWKPLYRDLADRYMSIVRARQEEERITKSKGLFSELMQRIPQEKLSSLKQLQEMEILTKHQWQSCLTREQRTQLTELMEQNKNG